MGQKGKENGTEKMFFKFPYDEITEIFSIFLFNNSFNNLQFNFLFMC